MTAAEHVDRRAARFRGEFGLLLVLKVAQRLLSAVFAPSEVALGAQDAPRALRVNSDLLAITKLAKPNRLNSCASFLARPL